MEMRKCLNGHYYDASVHGECPYCNGNGKESVTVAVSGTAFAGSGDSDRTVPLGVQASQPSFGTNNSERTMPLGYQQSAPMPAQAPVMQASSSMNTKPNRSEEDGRTVAIIRKEMGIDPVVGWLVCIDGKEKGRDYRIHSDNNFVGRSEHMDICIRGDETISRENHVIISYDSRDKVFYCSPGDGRSIVRVNDKAIFQTVEIKAYDQITVGATVLGFIPFCGAGFEWKGSEDVGEKENSK